MIDSIIPLKNAIINNPIIFLLFIIILILVIKNYLNKRYFSKQNQEYTNLLKRHSTLIVENIEYKNKINEYENQKKINLIRYKQNKELEEVKNNLKKTFEYKANLIQESNLTSKNLLNNHEFDIYKKLVTCKDITNNFIVLSQVPLKAFIENSSNDDMWKIYSNYYVDFLFIIKDFRNNKTTPIAILEFNGNGHYINDREKVEKNDKVKEATLRKIGIKLFVVNGDEIYEDSVNKIDKNKLDNKILYLAQELSNLKN
ncbi:DUF2726 domain-containing protein [Campylobacter fetus]|uniref:DUF2726 domain-containing protein n=1 Tax=Campylobacter fetus TaxID=196 RepID=UPI000818BAFA|nr:DUF2726 domain-containing protein [Campylobacter fetus]OCR84581.1 hypothetical protein CFT12S05168_09085 [Campylobacter fetus subsp. testudinum]OCR95646.1 hypothetical protein CFT12S02847_07485 [Campylobacter fetus subsp. testudinum]